jgi:hypothetical protein
LRDEVESLLAAHDQQDSFLEHPCPADAVRLLVDHERSNLVGETLGSYRLLRLVGRGGLSEVYLAEDRRLARPVAVKLLTRYRAGDQDNVRRFRREALTASVIPWSFTSDGKRLAYYGLDLDTSYDLWTVPLKNDGAGLRAGKPGGFLQTPADERFPSFSPDGKWLAYAARESGSFRVYIRAFPDTGGKWQISSAGGAYPMWSRSGRELFFESLDNRIMVAGYTVHRDSFVPDKPQLWSEKALANTVTFNKNVDLAPDGKRVVALMTAEGLKTQQSQHDIVFLENFFDDLRRRAPVKRPCGR